MSASTIMVWRRCPAFPNYEVSDSGDVRRAPDVAHQPGRRLRGYIDTDGYLRYSLDHHIIGAHQLVALTFIGPAPSVRHEVAHCNGSRLLNAPSNLRWALPVENRADRVLHGTESVGTANGRAKITDDDVRYIRRRYREIKAARGRVGELDEKFGLCRGQIIRIAKYQAWSHVK